MKLMSVMVNSSARSAQPLPWGDARLFVCRGTLALLACRPVISGFLVGLVTILKSLVQRSLRFDEVPNKISTDCNRLTISRVPPYTPEGAAALCAGRGNGSLEIF